MDFFPLRHGLVPISRRLFPLIPAAVGKREGFRTAWLFFVRTNRSTAISLPLFFFAFRSLISNSGIAEILGQAKRNKFRFLPFGQANEKKRFFFFAFRSLIRNFAANKLKQINP
ncbi:MAG: hypothetical protein IJ243_05775 [Prevotella sp.]|nr:hypothetical protein [Prevotella sp.]